MSGTHPYTPALEITKELIALTQKKLNLLRQMERSLWYLSHFNLDPKSKVYAVTSWDTLKLVDATTKEVVAEAPLNSIPHEYRSQDSGTYDHRRTR